MPLQPGFDLQPHQQRVRDQAAQAAASGEPYRVLLNWGLGSGKSLGALSTADALGGSAAVVAPAALRPTLRDEQKKFLGRTDIPVFSYQNAVAGKVPRTDTLVADESQRIGSPASAQAAAVARLAESAKNLILLSGTPIRNSPAEFASLMGALTGKPITHDQFRERYIGTETVKPGIWGRLRGLQSVTRPALVNTDELKALLSGHVDYYHPEKPPVDVVHETHEAEMTPRQAELYSGMFGKLPMLLRWKLRWNYPLSDHELASARAFLTGPRQVALSDLPYRADKDPYRAFLNSGKLTKAYELLNETLNADKRTKAIIYSNFVDAGLRPYQAALAKAGIPHAMFHGALTDEERKQMVNDFNEGRTRVALVAPAGAEGISLKGAQLTQLLDNHWQNARLNQVIGRGLRYDSHTYLPDELKRMKVQKFVAKVPLSVRDRLMEQIGFDRSAQRASVDDYLHSLADRKDVLNDQFLRLLKEVGSNRQKTSAELQESVDSVKHVLRRAEFEKLASIVKTVVPETHTPDPTAANKKKRDWLPWIAAGTALTGAGLLAAAHLRDNNDTTTPAKPVMPPADTAPIPSVQPAPRLTPPTPPPVPVYGKPDDSYVGDMEPSVQYVVNRMNNELPSNALNPAKGAPRMVPNLQPDTLRPNIARFYTAAPGGFDGAITRAEAAGKTPVPGFRALTNLNAKLDEPIRVEYDQKQTPFYDAANRRANLQYGEPGSDELMRLDGPPPRWYQIIREHELTHGAFVGSSKKIPPLGNTTDLQHPADRKAINYMTDPDEIDARLAEIKRYYVAAHPGTDVNTPEQAENAWNWFFTDGIKTHADKNLLADLSVWRRAKNWDKLKKMFMQRMPQLVYGDTDSAVSKAANSTVDADRENCPHCGAMHERGDGRCNRCGNDWPAVTKRSADEGHGGGRGHQQVDQGRADGQPHVPVTSADVLELGVQAVRRALKRGSCGGGGPRGEADRPRAAVERDAQHGAARNDRPRDHGTGDDRPDDRARKEGGTGLPQRGDVVSDDARHGVGAHVHGAGEGRGGAPALGGTAEAADRRTGAAELPHGMEVSVKSSTEVTNPFREAKRYSDMGTADGYAQKAEILRKLVTANPDQWTVDDDSHPYVVGITHTPSGWRYHVPRFATQGWPLPGRDA